MSRLQVLIAATFAALLTLPASAVPLVYRTDLAPEADGAKGDGFATVVFETSTNDLTINIEFTGLSGLSTVAHIHCCTALPGTGTIGVAVTPGTLPGFPVGVKELFGYSVTVDLDVASSFTGGATGFLTRSGGTVDAARAALLAGFENGTAYVNVHSRTFPGGEIRGFLQVPEPASYALALVALAGLAGASRRGSSARGR